ncbi:unnamed protein product [Closterium sp. Naga37s-1]|nr:unnamed protein product [Closterium sp. Naga37s-1]
MSNVWVCLFATLLSPLRPPSLASPLCPPSLSSPIHPPSLPSPFRPPSLPPPLRPPSLASLLSPPSLPSPLRPPSLASPLHSASTSPAALLSSPMPSTPPSPLFSLTLLLALPPLGQHTLCIPLGLHPFHASHHHIAPISLMPQTASMGQPVPPTQCCWGDCKGERVKGRTLLPFHTPRQPILPSSVFLLRLLIPLLPPLAPFPPSLHTH